MSKLSFNEYIINELTDLEAEKTLQNDATAHLRRKPNEQDSIRAAKTKVMDQRRSKKTPIDNRIRALKIQLAKALQMKKSQEEQGI